MLRTLANLGSWFDIVSDGELQRVITAGGDPRRCVFAGAGKTEAGDRIRAEAGCLFVQRRERAGIAAHQPVAARLKKIAPVAVRVNPDVAADTHAKITTGTYEDKFGIAFEQIEGVYARAAKLKNLRLRGVQMHIGSQITETTPFENAVRKMLPLVQKLKATARHWNFSASAAGWASSTNTRWRAARPAGGNRRRRKTFLRRKNTPTRLLPLLQPLGLKILMEPGRFISGNAGILVTHVEYVKRTGRKNFVIVDAAMNDLIRPAFYEAYHEIVPLDPPGRRGDDVVRCRGRRL